MFKNNYSPKTNKIIYYEDNHKLLKKRKNRISIGKILIFDSSSIKENDLNYTNKKNQRNINVKDNHNLNKSNEIYDSSNKIIYKNYTQPVINRNNNKINITSINEIDSIKEFGLLNDFFNELEDNENNNDKENNYMKNENKPMTNELNKLFERNGYSTYFHPSRTQQSVNFIIYMRIIFILIFLHLYTHKNERIIGYNAYFSSFFNLPIKKVNIMENLIYIDQFIFIR